MGIFSNTPKKDKKTKFFDELYETNAKALQKYAYSLLGDQELAKDLVQSAFTELLVKIDKVITHPKPLAWMFKTIYTIYRREAALKHKIVMVPFNEEGIVASLFVREPENKDSLFELMPVGLSEDDQQILLWRFSEDLDNRAIANRLGITESACRQRVSRAVHRCGNLLNSPEPPNL